MITVSKDVMLLKFTLLHVNRALILLIILLYFIWLLSKHKKVANWNFELQVALRFRAVLNV